MRDGPILDFNRIDVMTGKTNCAVKENWRHERRVFLKVMGCFTEKSMVGEGKFKERLLSAGFLTAISMCVRILSWAWLLKLNVCDGHAQKIKCCCCFH